MDQLKTAGWAMIVVMVGWGMFFVSKLDSANPGWSFPILFLPAIASLTVVFTLIVALVEE